MEQHKFQNFVVWMKFYMVVHCEKQILRKALRVFTESQDMVV